MKKIPVRHITEKGKQPDSSQRFTIRDLSALLNGKNMVQALHRHDFFFILLLQSGEGNHEIDFVPYRVVDKVVFCMRPGQVHQLHLEAGCTGYLMEFDGGFYHPSNKLSSHRLRRATNKTLFALDDNRLGKLYAVLTCIFQEYTNKEEGYYTIIKANLDIFFIELVRQSQHPNNSSTNVNPYIQERLDEFLDLLEIHMTTHKQVAQYTELMNLSSYQLNEITKATIGKSASEIINEHILLEIKRYLLGTPDQIKEIADLLGYEDVSYFIRFFKKHTGHSPEAFRHNFN